MSGSTSSAEEMVVLFSSLEYLIFSFFPSMVVTKGCVSVRFIGNANVLTIWRRRKCLRVIHFLLLRLDGMHVHYTRQIIGGIFAFKIKPFIVRESLPSLVNG